MKIALVGELCEDIIMHFPVSHEVLGTKIWAEDITIAAGGSASYACQALDKMGVATKIFSSLGDDESAERVLRQLMTLEAVECSTVSMKKHTKTTKSMIVCNGSEKDFIGCSPMIEIEIPRIEELLGIDLLYIAGYALYPELWNERFLRLLTEARQRGILIVLDCQLLPIADIELSKLCRLPQILAVVDHALFAKKEMLSLLGTIEPEQAVKQLSVLGYDKTAIFKNGASGCTVAERGVLTNIPAYPVEVYDAVGSGDIFGAAYCYGIGRKWHVTDCAKFATVYAAKSLGKFEKTKNYPQVQEVIDLVKRQWRNNT